MGLYSNGTTGPRCICGKAMFKTRDAAKRAARNLHSDKRPYRCEITTIPNTWHVGELAASVIAGEVTRGEVYAAVHDEVDARRLVGQRSNRGCETCGGNGYEFSHRRTRAIRDDHLWCPCNGTLSCHTCHEWLHRHPDDAKVLGLMVSRYVDEPGTVPARLKTGWVLLHCDGSVTPLHEDQVTTTDWGTPALVA